MNAAPALDMTWLRADPLTLLRARRASNFDRITASREQALRGRCRAVATQISPPTADEAVRIQNRPRLAGEAAV